MEKQINIIGSGYMGSQISALYYCLGYKVNIFYNLNKNEKNLKKNISLIKRKLPIHSDGKISFFEKININQIPTIECISEEYRKKVELFKIIFDQYDTNIFSNTSSIQTNSINANISILHFMNPIFLKIVEVCKNKVDNKGIEIISDLIEKDFLVLDLPHGNHGAINKIIFSEISNFFELIEKENFDKNNLLEVTKKIKGYNILNLIDIIGSDISLLIIKNFVRNKNLKYEPYFFKDLIKRKIYGKKNNTSVSSFFRSDDYPDKKKLKNIEN
jgi:3-hydroxyacyl-CoA dehydrogenase